MISNTMAVRWSLFSTYDGKIGNIKSIVFITILNKTESLGYYQTIQIQMILLF